MYSFRLKNIFKSFVLSRTGARPIPNWLRLFQNGRQALSLLILGALNLTGCAQKPTHTLSFSGTLEATEVLVSAKSAGTVEALWIDEGDTVQVAQQIAQLDTEKIYLQKKQLLAGLDELRLNLQNAQRGIGLAKDNLTNMEKKYQRLKSLLAENSVTQQQFDDLETALKAAQTQYENAGTSLKALKAKEAQVRVQLELVQSQLRDTKIFSPLAGTVIEKYLELGEIARPGGAVANLADLKRMWIKIYLKETELGKIKLNDQVEIKISSVPTRGFPGRITWISARAEFTPKMVQTKEARADLVYAAKVAVANPDGILKIGMPADVEVNLE
ncbi:efflux RND transporter periplasmic adaptor subunit [candidate division KSB1 bacterium]|nr:efflux RND transporter periplasmic adaptor subunit [candidate division KSB1 bacterium]